MRSNNICEEIGMSREDRRGGVNALSFLFFFFFPAVDSERCAASQYSTISVVQKQGKPCKQNTSIWPKKQERGTPRKSDSAAGSCQCPVEWRIALLLYGIGMFASVTIGRRLYYKCTSIGVFV